MNIQHVLAKLRGTNSASPSAASTQEKSQAFAELVRHFQGPLFGFLGRLGLAQAQAQDIAQDTLLRAWTHMESYQPERAEFSTWLFTIARNLAFNAMARASARHEVAQTDEAMPEPESATEQLGPEQLLELAQRKAQLVQALRQLPMEERSVLALAYVQELNLHAIAKIEGCTLAAVKTRLHRAKLKLRALLDPTYSSSTKEASA